MTRASKPPRKAHAEISGPHPGLSGWLVGRYRVKFWLDDDPQYFVAAYSIESARRKARKYVDELNAREQRNSSVEVIE